MTYSPDIPIKVTRIALKGAREWQGRQFPLAYQVSGAEPPTLEDSTAFLRELGASGELTRLLQEHGGVLFRGFGSPSAETFSTLVNAAERGRKNMPYEQVGLAGKRTIQAPEVFTANEGPETQRFFLHNEYARYTRYPGFIHFYCEIAPVTGGESPVGNSLEMFERINAEIPDFVEEVQKRGLSMTQIYPAPYENDGKSNYFDYTGVDTFGHTLQPGDEPTTVRRKVEEQVRRLTDDFEWLEDGSIKVVQHVSAANRYLGHPNWFNGLSGRHGTATFMNAVEPPYKGTDGKTYPPARYTDGTEIPRTIEIC
ncbi:uncharacterized protein IL334_002221 [Kwoniella shivajii]|uniref:TauD/TfdA-like domain-containing protein n=1 Tax=Kwoniella shivajii TaxID=564305 RepID=A0ABZ1CUR2_9TREE|nr:hypothetical protein IL334_002221 [Kwoniella shivajii]